MEKKERENKNIASLVVVGRVFFFSPSLWCPQHFCRVRFFFVFFQPFRLEVTEVIDLLKNKNFYCKGYADELQIYKNDLNAFLFKKKNVQYYHFPYFYVLADITTTSRPFQNTRRCSNTIEGAKNNNIMEWWSSHHLISVPIFCCRCCISLLKCLVWKRCDKVFTVTNNCFKLEGMWQGYK